MVQLFVIFSFIVWSISLLGWGCFVDEILRKVFTNLEINDEFKFLYYVILGFLIVYILGAVFNFFIPLGILFSVVILAAGLLSSFIYRKKISLPASWFDKIGILILFLYSCLLPLADLKNYDTLLYHFPMISWISQYPLPFGIANIYEKFGFNSTWFIDAAIINPLRIVTETPFFIVNAIMFFFFGIFIFFTSVKMIKENSINFSSIFVLLTAIPWFCCLRNIISSPSPDAPNMLLILFITFLLIKAVETKNIDYFFILLPISFYAVTIKLSAAPYFIVIFLILLFAVIFKKYSMKVFNTGSEFKKTIMPKYIAANFISLIVAILYFIRGIISSGYPFYPSIFGHIDFKWSVPVEITINAENFIKSWARNPGANPDLVLKNWNWLKPWFYQLITDKLLMGMLALGVLSVIFYFIFKRRKKLVAFLFVLSVSFFGCLFWFFTAPALRFGYGYLYSVAGIMLGYGLYNFLSSKKDRIIILKILCLFILILFFYKNELNLKEIRSADKNRNELEQYFNRPLVSTRSLNENLRIDFDKNNKPTMIWLEN